MKSQIDVINVNERPSEKRGATERTSEMEKREQRRIREKKRQMRKRARRLQMIRLIASAGLMVLVLSAAVHLLREETKGVGSANAGASSSCGFHGG